MARVTPSIYLISALIGMLCSGYYANAAANDMEVKYINRGAKDFLNQYKYDLIQRALDVTQAEFGPYQITPFKDDPGAKRLAVLVSQGTQLNVTWASPGTIRDSDQAIAIPIDILKGTLGDRVCLIDKQHHTNLQHIKSLRDLRIGQGITWEDISIYNANGIDVAKGPNIENLITMLASGRFDCLALGVNEANDVLQQYVSEFPNLAVDSKLLIHYDYPIYLYISAKFPRLATRLKRGIESLQQSHEFDQLFEKYYAKNIEKLHTTQRTRFCLLSPFLPPEKQCKK